MNIVMMGAQGTGKGTVAGILKERLDIPHISCYSLILEEHTKLYIDKHVYISEDKDREMYEHIKDTLVRNGYKHYEISNYAKEHHHSTQSAACRTVHGSWHHRLRPEDSLRHSRG